MTRGALTLDAITPAQLAAALGWSERRVRDKARELGACRILGNRMVLLPQDVDTIMEATKCPSSFLSGKRSMEDIFGTTGGQLPAIDYERFDFETATKTPVDQDWLDTFLMYARPVIKALVLVMFGTACRFCEAHRLNWPDLNFNRRTIKIRDTKTGKRRTAHMQQQLLVALANLPRDRAPFYRSESTLRRYWDEDVATTAKAVEGFDRLTFHCCRHGFATDMLRKGVDPKTAASLGGWDDIGLFMETYAHAMQDKTLTDKLFDTPLTRGDSPPQQKQEVSKK